MDLRLIQSDKNNFPLKGMLIRNSSVASCLEESQLLGLTLSEIKIYLIPGTVPGVIWGCLLTFESIIPREKIGKHQLCQAVSPSLWIPERSKLLPQLTVTELEKLFPTPFICHPDFGWVELEEPLDIAQLLAEPSYNHQESIKPSPSIVVPMTIRSFQIYSVPQDEVMNKLENEVFPQRKKFEEKPLSIFEKIRLQFYRIAFQRAETLKDGLSGSLKDNHPTMFQKLLKSFKMNDRMEQDFQDLEERNKKNIDKLMDLLKKDPDEALQYAIPLDEGGSTRGGPTANFDFLKRWSNFSLSGNRGNTTGSGIVDLGNNFYELQKQYRATAEELIKKNEHQKAAFVYMKLLKNYDLAAQTLADGKHYQEAATIYLKHCNAKKKAAECYEKGSMITDAIEIYKELNEFEKVGDLYMSISNRQQAFVNYQKVVESYKQNGRYVKAALIYREKMNNPLASQSILLDGWRNHKDAVNCLTNYFEDIEDSHFHSELKAIYNQDVNERNAESFLEVIRHDYRKRTPFRDTIKNMAYELVSKNIGSNPSIVTKLKNFSPENKELFKDTLRFKLSRNSKK